MLDREKSTGRLDQLEQHSFDGQDHDLALKHMPVLMLDQAEPYMPVAMGYTVFRQKGQSPSSKFQIVPKGGEAIEYAIWYDWDIQHMYDLEHVWVYLDEAGQVIRIDASRHGKRVEMTTDRGPQRQDFNRPRIYCEAGKHAHWPSDEAMRRGAGTYLPAMCGDLAGFWGVHEGNFFCEGGLFKPTPRAHRLAKLKTKADAFYPSFAFGPLTDEAIKLVPWPALARWIPARMNHLMAELPAIVPHIKAVFFDCGDTIIDEATEEKVPGTEIVTSAAFIPGGEAMVRKVKEAGFVMALVADGPRKTFENILKPSGLWDLFEAHVISGDIGELKPSAKMFSAATKALAIRTSDIGDSVMIGNNLARDIKGANDFGMRSVFMRWSERRSHRPSEVSMIPDHTIDCPSDFLPLLHQLEEDMAEAVRQTRIFADAGETVSP